jgi:hypothetical protein
VASKYEEKMKAIELLTSRCLPELGREGARSPTVTITCTMAKEAGNDESPSKLIDERIGELGDWRGETLAKVRGLIKQADPDVVEEVKWRKPGNPLGVPVWSHEGIVCTGETYKDRVKLTFAKGASLKDPSKLFNSSLEGNVRRAIDIHEDEEIDEAALKALIGEAVALNAGGKKK